MCVLARVYTLGRMGDKEDEIEKRSGDPLRNNQKFHLEKLMSNPVSQTLLAIAYAQLVVHTYLES